MKFQGRDSGWAGRYTRNPFRLAWGALRYNVGNRVDHFLEKLGVENGWLRKWSYSSESAYNCIILPELGRKVRTERRQEREWRKNRWQK